MNELEQLHALINDLMRIQPYDTAKMLPLLKAAEELNRALDQAKSLLAAAAAPQRVNA
jgi:hypothetical protein